MNKIIPFSQLIDEQWLRKHGVVDFAHTNTSTPLTLNHYQSWLDRGDHGALKYMGDHRAEIRKDIKNIFPEFKTAIVFLFSYAHMTKKLNEFYQSDKSNKLKLASYVLGFEGKDYHLQILEILEQMKQKITNYDNSVMIRHSLDIQPVLERDLAYRSGLGWFGKNSMLISRSHGSYFMIASLLLSQEVDLSPRAMEVDHCGHCRACVEGCPTEAINESQRSINADQCISTFTIELFKYAPSPVGMVENAQGEIFGCDICQVLCPWNRRAQEKGKVDILSSDIPEHLQRIYTFFMTRNIDQIIEDLESMSNKYFKKFFKNTALERTGRIGLLKNLKVISKKQN